MIKNKVKENLQNKVPSVGVIMGIYSPALVEMIGHAGYDFIIIDGEHGVFSWSEMENMIRTSLLADLVPIVRVDYDPSSIQKVLDQGALGVQVPMVNTKEDAEEVVQRVKYPPIGKRGTAFMTRAAGFGYQGGKGFMDASDENIIISAHIETPEAVRNLEDIITVPGIDIAFVGPFDLSVNMGYKEGINHPEVLKTIDSIYEKAHKHDIPVGTIANTKETVQQMIDKGTLFIPVVATELIKNAFNGPIS